MTCPHAVLKDRHHSRYPRAARDADNILALVRVIDGSAERSKNLDLDVTFAAREQPVTKPAAWLAFHNERNLACVVVEIDHRICAATGQIACLQDDELSCLEIHRLGQMQVEMRHIVRQPANATNKGAAAARAAGLSGGDNR